MNGISEVAATIHILDEEIDTGDIIFQEKKQLGIERPYPKDYDRETQKIISKMLEDFLDEIEQKGALTLKPQRNDESTCLPRLYTELNGAIDFSWDAIDVERFIRAFGPLYPGVFTFIGSDKIHIRKMRLSPTHPKYHPFLAGKILAILDNGDARVALHDHDLIVQEVAFKGEICKPSKVCKIMQTLHTPVEHLTRAKVVIPKAKNMCDVPEALRS